MKTWKTRTGGMIGLATALALGAAFVAPGLLSPPASAADGAAGDRWASTLLVQLAVSDLDRSIEFYTKTLGFELEARNDELEWARIKVGISGVTIGLGTATPPEGSGSVSLNFGVRNIEKTRAELEAQGVEFLGPTINIPGVVQLADFHDPDGNKIRLAGHSAGYGEE